MLVIPETFDSESSNLNFEVFRLIFANLTRLTAVKRFLALYHHKKARERDLELGDGL